MNKHPPYDVTVSIWDLYSFHPWPKMPSRTNYCGKAEATTCPPRPCWSSVHWANSERWKSAGSRPVIWAPLQMCEVTNVRTEASRETFAEATSILTEPRKQRNTVWENMWVWDLHRREKANSTSVSSQKMPVHGHLHSITDQHIKQILMLKYELMLQLKRSLWTAS